MENQSKDDFKQNKTKKNSVSRAIINPPPATFVARAAATTRNEKKKRKKFLQENKFEKRQLIRRRRRRRRRYRRTSHARRIKRHEEKEEEEDDDDEEEKEENSVNPALRSPRSARRERHRVHRIQQSTITPRQETSSFFSHRRVYKTKWNPVMSILMNLGAVKITRNTLPKSTLMVIADEKKRAFLRSVYL